MSLDEGVIVILNNAKEKLEVGFKAGLMPAHMDYLRAVAFNWYLQFIIQVANAFKCKQ